MDFDKLEKTIDENILVNIVPSKQYFLNLEDVENLNNYDVLPVQEYAEFECRNSAKTFVI